jgi:hypothetical protein
VRHCGHPTANYPYYLVSPEPRLAGCTVVSFNGMGFCRLGIAMEVVERIVAGEAEVTRRRCVPGVARIIGVTADGENVEETCDSN